MNIFKEIYFSDCLNTIHTLQRRFLLSNPALPSCGLTRLYELEKFNDFHVVTQLRPDIFFDDDVADDVADDLITDQFENSNSDAAQVGQLYTIIEELSDDDEVKNMMKDEETHQNNAQGHLLQSSNTFDEHHDAEDSKNDDGFFMRKTYSIESCLEKAEDHESSLSDGRIELDDLDLSDDIIEDYHLSNSQPLSRINVSNDEERLIEVICALSDISIESDDHSITPFSSCSIRDDIFANELNDDLFAVMHSPKSNYFPQED